MQKQRKGALESAAINALRVGLAAFTLSTFLLVFNLYDSYKKTVAHGEDAIHGVTKSAWAGFSDGVKIPNSHVYIKLPDPMFRDDRSGYRTVFPDKKYAQPDADSIYSYINDGVGDYQKLKLDPPNSEKIISLARWIEGLKILELFLQNFPATCLLPSVTFGFMTYLMERNWSSASVSSQRMRREAP